MALHKSVLPIIETQASKRPFQGWNCALLQAADGALPPIARKNTVADRSHNRRFQSEPRYHREAVQQSLPRVLQASEAVPLPGRRFTSYVQPRDASHIKDRRQKSLPARKPGSDEVSGRVRKINSAPDNDKGPAHHSPHLTSVVPVSRATDIGHSPERMQRIHGVSTRAHEENYLRSHKFATSWAQVRAENLALREGSPCENMASHRTRESSESPRGRPTGNDTPRDGSPKKSHSSPYKTSPRLPKKVPRGRPPHKQNRAKPTIHIPHSPNASVERETNSSMLQSFAETNSQFMSEDGQKQNDEEGTEPRNNSTEHKTTKRSPWNSNVNIVVDTKPPPRISSKAYERGLTFKPTLTSNHDVYMAYVGNEKETGNVSGSDDEAYVSPAYESDDFHSNDSSPARSKERVLNRREAEMYIKMNAVYGSDAFKNQRKEWFLQKVAKVQEEKAKLAEEKKKADQMKREKDRIKQQEQLDYVRDKFRRRQHHRFRTQYITSRVLEHERCNRHEYGLPEDYDDPWGIKSRDEMDEDEKETAGTNGDGAKHGTKTKIQPGNQGQNNPYKNNKQRKAEKAAQQQRQRQEQKDAEAMRQVREQQKAWYANGQTVSEGSVSPIASQVTSGYESGKSPTRHHEDKENAKTTDKVPKFNKKQTDDSAHVSKVRSEAIYLQDQKRRNVPQKPDIKHAPVTQNARRGSPTKKPAPKVAALGVSKEVPQHLSKDSPSGQEHVSTSPDTKGNKSAADHLGSSTDAMTVKDDKALVYTGHFRQEKDPLYHRLETPEKIEVGTVQTASKAPPQSGPQTQGDDIVGNKSVTANESNQTKDSETLTSKQNSKETPSQNIKNTASSKSNNNKEKDHEGAKSIESATIQKNNTPNNVQTTSASKVNGDILPSDKHVESSKTPQKSQQQNNAKDNGTIQAGSKVSDRKQSSVSNGAVSNKDKSSSFNNKPTNSATTHSNVAKPSVPSSQTTQNQRDPPQSRSSKQTAYASATDEKRNNISPSSKPDEKTKDIPSSSKPMEHKSDNKRPVASSVTQSSLDTKNNNKKPAGKSEKSRDQDKKQHRDKKASLAAMMFDVNTGPSWDPHAKVPKMEGIDTVVVPSKDGKGRVVMRKKNVKDVVKEANDALKVSDAVEPSVRKPNSRRSYNRAVSDDVTLGSDFEVDDDEDETEDDIFERLRRKYNIKIDSDEED